MAYEIPQLPYALDALEPYVNTLTMDCHYNGHHKAYVANLNKALADFPELAAKSPEELIGNLSALPEKIRTAVRNNGGGHVNHSMFWKMMAPRAGGEPSGRVLEALASSFGSFSDFQGKFEAAGLGRFGSGWVWLVRTAAGSLEVTSTPNQDSPLMEGGYPLLGCDVWEHAYYLKYQFRRGDWLKAFWNLVNWSEVERRFESKAA